MLRSKLCFLMTYFYMWKTKITFMQCKMVKVILTFSRMKLVFLSQFYCCQGIAKFHIGMFIRQMHLTHTQSHVQWAEIDFNRYCQTLSWLTAHRLQKIDTSKYKYYLKSGISVSNSMVHLLFTALMKSWFLTMENKTQNNLLEESPLGLSSNFGAPSHLKGISFMQNHTVD